MMHRSAISRLSLTVVSCFALAAAQPGLAHSAMPHISFTDQPLAVFLPATQHGIAPAEDTVLRARPVEVNFDALLGLDHPIGAELALQFFDDVQVTGRIDSVDERGLSSFTWSGKIHINGADDPFGGEGSFILVVEDESVVVAVWLEDARTFEMRSDAQGVHWVRELEQARFTPCEASHEHEVHADDIDFLAPNPLASTPCIDDGSLIDILIVYTPSARDAAGGTSAIVALAESSIAATNNAYASSNINTRMRLVHVAQVDYTESGSNSTDLSRLRGKDNGYMDNVHTLRDQYKADLVAMLHNGPGCGVGYLMTDLSLGFESWAFSITRYTCAVGNLTMAHEIGHNQGCAHDRDNAGSSLYNFSFGHRWFSTNGNQYRSVMAYSPGSRVPRLSNPDVSYIGTPTGIAPGQTNSAANAQSINLASLVISNFRNSGEVIAPSITSEPEELSLEVSQTAVFQASVSGSAPITYQWLKNNQPLSDNVRISGSNTTMLVIEQLEFNDSGMYQLSVSNSCSSVNTIQVPLIVVEPACLGDIADDFGFTSADGGGPDGVVDFGDFVALLGLIGPCDGGTPGCLGDIADDFGFTAADGGGPDGQVDFGDFVALLGLIGPCE